MSTCKWSRNNVLSIPIAAVDNTENETQVYRVNAEGAIEIAPVKVGLQTPTSAELLPA